MLTAHINYFQENPLDLPKTTILLDNGYHPDKIQAALKTIYPEIMTKIQFEVSAKPSKAEKGQSGFVPVATRWVIERSNAWVERCKNLVKNFEWTLEHARAKLNLCFIRLLVILACSLIAWGAWQQVVVGLDSHSVVMAYPTALLPLPAFLCATAIGLMACTELIKREPLYLGVEPEME